MLQALMTRQGGGIWTKIQRLGLGKSRLHPCSQLVKSIESHPRCGFTTSSSHLVAKKARALPKGSKTSFQPAKNAPPAPLQYKIFTFTDMLAARKSPTLLFQASSHAWYTVSCFLLGGFCFTYTGINMYTQFLYPPEETWGPSIYLTGGVCCFMFVIGILFAIRVSRNQSNWWIRPRTDGLKAVPNHPNDQRNSFIVNIWDS